MVIITCLYEIITKLVPTTLGQLWLRNDYYVDFDVCMIGECILFYYTSLQEFEKVLKQKQVELELLEVKLAQKSVAVAQERENNMAERQCVSITKH